MKQKIIAVFAGTFKQFDNYEKEYKSHSQNNVKLIYIKDKASYLGYQFDELLLIGTYYDNESYSKYISDVESRVIIK